MLSGLRRFYSIRCKGMFIFVAEIKFLMKNKFIFAQITLFLLLIPGMLAAQQKISITGALLGAEISGINLSLSDALDPKQESLTTTTDVQGNFTFQLSIDKLTVFKLAESTSNHLIIFALPGDFIEVRMPAPKFNQHPVISGSDETRLAYSIAQKVAVFDRKMDSLNNQYTLAQKNPDFMEVKAGMELAYKELAASKQNYLRNELLAHSKSPASLLFLDKLEIAENLDVYEAVATGVLSVYPDFALARNMSERVEMEHKLAPGKPAPEIALPTPLDSLFKLSNLRGKVVMVDFWASWCGPCRRDNPEVVRMYNRFNAQGFEILGVSLDRDRSAWLNAIAKDGLIWNQVSDLKYWQSEAAKTYGVKSIPHTVLINRDGTIIARGLRGKALELKLEEVFKGE